MKLLLIDHEDSFVYNLYQALASLGARVDCLRYTAGVDAAVATDPDGLVLSPGPGHPSDRRVTGLSRALLTRWARERPVLGVCLGHQLIAEFYGGRVVRAEAPVHGEAVAIRHRESPLLAGVPSPFRAARYHSLVVDGARLPPRLRVTARADGGTVMALDHRSAPVHGVQFHPESYLTPDGPRILANFLAEVRR